MFNTPHSVATGYGLVTERQLFAVFNRVASVSRVWVPRCACTGHAVGLGFVTFFHPLGAQFALACDGPSSPAHATAPWFFVVRTLKEVR